TPTFDWSDGVDVSYYRLQVDDNANFSSPVLDVWVRTSTYSPSTALSNGTYVWRVRIQDTMGTWSDWSTPWTLEVDGQMPATPTLLSPADGSTTNDLTPAFDWSDGIDVSYYRLQVDDNANFSSPILDVWVRASTHSPRTALSNNTYTWRVRIQDTMGTWSDWSTPWTLIVLNDSEAPSVPADLIATPISASQIDLSWTASSDNIGVAGYRIYRNGGATAIGVSTSTSYQDTWLAASTEYTYTMTAYDAAGNESAPSAPTSATTGENYPSFLSEPNSTSMIGKFTLELFGPRNTPDSGDPFTPIYLNYDKHTDQYLPVDNPTFNPWWEELQGAYTYRINIPSDYAYDKIRVELFDPDSANTSGTTFRYYDFNTGNSAEKNCGDELTARNDTCLADIEANYPDSEENPFWLIRIDENRSPGGGSPVPDEYVESRNTTTLYRLFYYAEQVDGSLAPVDLAYYIGKPSGPEAEATDLTWVSPGVTDVNELMPAFSNVAGGSSHPLDATAEPSVATENCDTVRMNGAPAYTWSAVTWAGSGAAACTGNGDFVVDLRSEVPDIYKAPGESSPTILYLEVRGLDGSSENGYAIWAGPSRTEDVDAAVPANLNARQVYMQRQMLVNNKTYHSSKGVSVYGIGHLPMKSTDEGPSLFPAAYLGAELGGQDILLDLFDKDMGTCQSKPCLPLIVYFENIPRTDWAVCFGSNSDCAGKEYTIQMDETQWAYDNWGDSKKWVSFRFTVPSDVIGVPFYGGRLIVQYDNGKTDTFGLKLSVETNPVIVD
ncbi:MAG: hypothetical protein JXB07_04325, partial [Anaerolineae bacterium]|nr:hypothetical protein [Anaerolineae bacterium]